MKSVWLTLHFHYRGPIAKLVMDVCTSGIELCEIQIL